MPLFHWFMIVGAVMGLGLVVLGVVMVIKKFAGEIEINLRIGSLKTGSAGLATTAFGLIFFFLCATAVRTVEEQRQEVDARDEQLALKDDAARQLLEKIADALTRVDLDTKIAILRTLTDASGEGSSSGPPAADGTVPDAPAAPVPGSPAVAAVPAAPPAPEAVNPELRKLTAQTLRALARIEQPGMVERIKRQDPAVGHSIERAQLEPAAARRVPELRLPPR